ncbi:MAG: aspartate phosphatase [Planctomycetia bacterium]|nr:aspartate phosphatase [Planctomycetia bacterium]
MDSQNRNPRRSGPRGPVVTSGLRWWLRLLLLLFGILCIDSLYLVATDLAAWISGESREDGLYLWAFLAHLVLGLMILVPFVVYGIGHARRGRFRPNRRAVAVGWGLLWIGIALLVTGVALVRVEVFGIRFGIDAPAVRSVVFWVHAASPLVAIWLFILHRLVGPRLRWGGGLAWGVGGIVTAALAFAVSTGTPVPRPALDVPVALATSSTPAFAPSLLETAHGGTVPTEHLLGNEHCIECHADAHAQWADSVHASSSFNNPLYAFSVRNTRQAMLDRFDDLGPSRFCAGCHDPAILMSGSWEQDRWTDPAAADEVAIDPLGSASIGCIVCHGIEDVSTLGNASYTFKDPPRYPFAFSGSPFLQWVNRQLILAKPDFHKRTFLKPVHESAEFCGACHKVFLPEVLNGYKWLPGQNHYDTWRLSGVSGRGIGSWYWPPQISDDCNGCHMPLVPSDTVAARVRDDSGEATVHHHGFHAANTGLAAIAMATTPGPEAAERLDRVIDACTRMNEEAIRLDLIGLRAEGRVDGAFRGPIGASPTWIEPGETVLLEAVTRTLRLGHPLTQGTADSNEIWIEIEARLVSDIATGSRSIGSSGRILDDGAVDPRAKFLDVWLLDREGRRIEQRNPEDIFVPLYNHQIPPGAADLTHYRIEIPPDASGELEIRGRVRYRKFDSQLMRHAFGPEEGRRLLETLPILDLATTTVSMPVGDASTTRVATTTVTAATWERWNDYGIGLVRAGSGGGVAKGQLAQAVEAFETVERLGISDGAINQGRAMLIEGRVDDAAAALGRAADAEDLRWPWAVDWYAAVVARENGDLEDAARRLERIIAARYPVAVERGYDFSRDERVWNELATVRFQLARRATTEDAEAEGLEAAIVAVDRSLALDSQRAQTWFLASTIRAAAGDDVGAASARAEFELLRPDDNARDRAIRLARSRSEIADHAAEPIAIYELGPGAARPITATGSDR